MFRDLVSCTEEEAAEKRDKGLYAEKHVEACKGSGNGKHAENRVPTPAKRSVKEAPKDQLLRQGRGDRGGQEKRDPAAFRVDPGRKEPGQRCTEEDRPQSHRRQACKRDGQGEQEPLKRGPPVDPPSHGPRSQGQKQHSFSPAHDPRQDQRIDGNAGPNSDGRGFQRQNASEEKERPFQARCGIVPDRRNVEKIMHRTYQLGSSRSRGRRMRRLASPRMR